MSIKYATDYSTYNTKQLKRVEISVCGRVLCMCYPLTLDYRRGDFKGYIGYLIVKKYI